MSERKRLFISGTIVGGIVGVLLFTFIYFLFYFNSPSLAYPNYDSSYRLDIEAATSFSIQKASPHVVGIVRYNNKDKESGSGSGVIYRLSETSAYVVTNYHVIENAKKLEVVFKDEERLEATVLGHDIITDLAVLTIPRGSISETIEFSDSSKLKVGEFVVAIGNPLGMNLYGSATLGIISSVERLIPIDIDKDGDHDWFASVIQTDAAINPGNSGGALVNLEGKLIGINSMKVAGNSVEGIGFSIPANIVLKVVNDIETYGAVRRPFLGVQPVSVSKLSKDDKMLLDIEDVTKGVYINDIVPQSPAEKAGIKIDDIITKVNGVEIKDVTEFRYQIYQHKTGDNITLTVIRLGKPLTIDVVLELRNSD